MDTSLPGRLSGWEVHGFRSMEDLDVANIVKEASGRWLRPNEIHAILSNYTCFTINVKPVNLPKGGTIVLFDRKMLRNFRKDGHNWKKKKDGKTVKEAHEHLKVGSEERIHVYYAHGQDNPKFVRRCYWLLDKALEHVVLVHYRETQEGSPFTPLNSHSGSELSDLSPSQLLLEDTGSEDYNACYAGTEEQLQPDDSVDVRDHAMRLHEINSADWDELLALNDPTYSSVPAGVGTGYFQPSDRYCMANVKDNGSNVSTSNLEAEMLSLGNPMESLAGIGPEHVSNTANMLFQTFDGQINANEQNRVSEVGIAETGDVLKNLAKEDLQTQDSFGSWINDIVIPASVKDPNFDSSVSISHQSFLSPTMTNHESPIPQQIFCITDISPTWACTSEETKILVIGYFYEECQHLEKSTLFCICGEICVPAQAVQPGVFRCLISPHGSGSVNFYLSIDRCKPISQILTFELRSPIYNYVDVGEYKSKWEEFRVQMRLAVLLFSTSKYHDILSVKLSENALKEAKKFSLKTSNIANSWAYLIKLMENGNIPFSQAKDSLFELTLKNRLIEWLFERIVDGSKISERDVQGQGVLHLCAILGYTWAVYPFSLSGLSIDFRDKFGWTALHWAAYYGREKMVAALLSAGAKPNLVTDPTSENPGGCTAANLASQKGYHGLAAYLSEKALVQQFKDMKMAGNASGSLETVTYTSVDPSNFDEEDIYLKDTLAAYRTVADAAARIQAAFREHSLKQRTKAVQSSKPEIEARYIIAALKIQHAFRNYERRKIAAAAHIQYRFRTWKLRKEFLNLRRQAIKIQAIFRGFQVRKQYRKILWSVGVLEKAVLRWRMKRRGFRGLQIGPSEALVDQKQESDTEEDFFQASRRQAEEHVVKAVVCVQSMFRSKQAQEEYTRMKLAHDAAMLESEESQLCYLLGVDRVDAPEN